MLACAEAGVAGYVTRDASVEDVVAAVESAARGEVLCSPRMVATLFERVATLALERSPASIESRLTARELEILNLIDQGLSNKEIARLPDDRAVDREEPRAQHLREAEREPAQRGGGAPPGAVLEPSGPRSSLPDRSRRSSIQLALLSGTGTKMNRRAHGCRVGRRARELGPLCAERLHRIHRHAAHAARDRRRSALATRRRHVSSTSRVTARPRRRCRPQRRAFVIVSSESGRAPTEVCRLLEERPHVKVFAIADGGRDGCLYELRPNLVLVGELSPPERRADRARRTATRRGLARPIALER